MDSEKRSAIFPAKQFSTIFEKQKELMDPKKRIGARQPR
jgi:hypothetical protein